jgi:tRNA A37 threonylcarbamoyladenosine dehydratase
MILKEAAIGIVGLGSAGSKIAVSLARMGVRNFYLVDHDILLPENLGRNELDWQQVGRHKAKGVETAIGLVNVEGTGDLKTLMGKSVSTSMLTLDGTA